MSAAGVLWSDGMRTWMRAKGLWLIALAALLPPVLTGSWALTHQDDVAPSALSIAPEDIHTGDTINVTAAVRNDWDHAAGPFNATLEVGYFEEAATGDLAFRSRASQTVRVPRLEAHASYPLNLTWTAQGGTYVAQVRADTADEVAELEENNNHLFRQFTVRFPETQQAPADPAGLNATAAGNGTVDLAVLDVSWTPRSVYAGQEANVTVQVANRGATEAVNATVLMRAFGASGLGYSSFPSATRQQVVSLAPGATTNVTLPWKPATLNQYAIQGVVLPPANHTEAAPADNVLYRETFVDREFRYEPPEERATAKAFYHDVLEVLHIRLLLPLLALFYAGSILDDERRRGGLDALLTRPVPRWQLPLVRSLQGFLVTAVAVSLGVLVTYVLLLGLPQAAAGYLWMPLLLTLLALFAYGGLFTLLGVWAERPYLVGLVYVLGVETAILAGRSVLINGRPLLQDWVTRFSLADWMSRALKGWDAKTSAWSGGEATTALWVVLAIGVGGLAAAAWWMTKREFPES
jgi:hypothetical protein